ncbi:nuclear transport factor 2 family protein [Kineococcus sp. NPDC059986]|uniref:nuclear transport factor 2 family protein n=1 Tax=Kineococcus sp. NPDC059986 TaxID=3155538 RepID=UPI00344BFFC3
MRTRLLALAATGLATALLAGCSGSSVAGPAPASSSAAVSASPSASGRDRLDRAAEQANLAVVDRLFATTPPGLTPGNRAVVARTAADGPYVAVHWHDTPDPAHPWNGTARVDLFRLQAGAVVQHWALAQAVPAAGASGHTMFDDAWTGAPVALTEAQEEQQRQFAVGAYDTLFRDRDATVLDRSFDPAYRQHNPLVPDGTAPLKQFFAGSSFPPQESALSLADGDVVWTFSRPVGGPAEQFTAADLFRVVDGKVVEHWDVVPGAAVGPTGS